MKNVLITGGCGFIGVNLTLQLLEKNYEVTVYDNLYQRDESTLEQACRDNGYDPPRVIEGDVNDLASLKDAVQSVTSVVHLAAFTNVRYSTKHPESDFETNSMGTFNVLEAIRQTDSVTDLVFASSNAAVGEVEGAVDETCVPEPLSPYGASKLHGEALCQVHYECYDLRTTSLRFANAYGPYASHKTSVIPKFIRRAKQEKPLEIYGDGRQTRDFIHAGDIASAIGTALENDDGGEIYQVASGTETEINTLAERIQELASRDGKSVEIVHTNPREGEIKYNYSSIQKIKDELGWTPRRTLDEGLEEVYDALSPKTE